MHIIDMSILNGNCPFGRRRGFVGPGNNLASRAACSLVAMQPGGNAVIARSQTGSIAVSVPHQALVVALSLGQSVLSQRAYHGKSQPRSLFRSVYRRLAFLPTLSFSGLRPGTRAMLLLSCVASRPLQPCYRIQQVIHLPPRILRVLRSIRPLPIPRPSSFQLGRQRALEHLDHILSEDREELEPVEGAAGCNVQALRRRVRRDDKVRSSRKGVPSSR